MSDSLNCDINCKKTHNAGEEIIFLKENVSELEKQVAIFRDVIRKYQHNEPIIEKGIGLLRQENARLQGKIKQADQVFEIVNNICNSVGEHPGASLRIQRWVQEAIAELRKG